jgi:hypothetical protein
MRHGRSLARAALAIVVLLALWDLFAVFFVLMNPEGYWDHKRIEGSEAVEKLLPVYGSALLVELAALAAIHRRSLLPSIGLLLASAITHLYTGLHTCADCSLAPGEAATAALAIVALILLIL